MSVDPVEPQRENGEDATEEVKPEDEPTQVEDAVTGHLDEPEDEPRRRVLRLRTAEQPKPLESQITRTRSGRVTRRIIESDLSDEDYDVSHRRSKPKPQGRSVPSQSTRTRSGRSAKEMDGFVVDDEEDGDSMFSGSYSRPSYSRKTRNSRLATLTNNLGDGDIDTAAFDDPPAASAHRRSLRRRNVHSDHSDLDFLDDESDDGRREYKLRKRSEVNYRIPTLQEIAATEPKNDPHVATSSKANKNGTAEKARLPFDVNTSALSHIFGNQDPDSSDDEGMPGTGKPGFAAGIGGAGMMAGGSSSIVDTGPGNLGKVTHPQNLADTDPLMSSSELGFEKIGGLDNHVQQLKEMVSLPLLYPEIFQRFSITPPRGVLFHGPPGTGKTLLARALANSCSTSEQRVSFFMRKGADALSKWVGEAERQLRLLFEEAKNSQPSIIFFDEIDGLAPVRSSKQEQIHSSIVSTLLALMDGMDGRGQVVIIGATNRPDAVDPALRRPGRFDREFYFPLPNAEARRTILDIHTSKWEPPLDEKFKDELAALTKGYGGADLRALCTEAALYAVQRRYPQIYKSTERLVIQPETIQVSARDFILSSKNLIPSTSRSASSHASPLPEHLTPLLGPTCQKAQSVISSILPNVSKPNVLKEAEYEEDDDAGFEKEKLLQDFEVFRVFRPRLLICSSQGMGQQYVGSAILHHLEGYHVQSLDLATLYNDASRTPEAACVQLFTEAKRHKPSVIYIPSLSSWISGVTDSTRATFASLLESLVPSDPIMLLALADCEWPDIPGEIQSWFGLLEKSQLYIDYPDNEQRGQFFQGVIDNVKRSPADYPDAVPRRKKVLEELPKAPPIPERVPTQAELDAQAQGDARVREYLKFRLGPILAELRKRYRRFTKPIGDDVGPLVLIPGATPAHREDTIEGPFTEDNIPPQPEACTPSLMGPGFQDIDLEKMHPALYYDKYLTADHFLKDIARIVLNAELDGEVELVHKARAMLTHARIMVDQACDAQFNMECARMAKRQRLRAKEAERRKNLTNGVMTRHKAKEEGRTLDFRVVDVSLLEKSLKRRRAGNSSNQYDSRSGSVTADAANESVGEPALKKNRMDIDIDENHDADADGEHDPERGDDEAAIHTTDCTDMSAAERADSVKALLNGIASEPTSRNSSNIEESHRIDTASGHTTSGPAILPNHSVSNEENHTDEGPVPTTHTEIETPAFIVPQDSLDTLQSLLRSQTSDVKIEHLEQIRAACFDLIWQEKSQWNRTELIHKLIDLADELIGTARVV